MHCRWERAPSTVTSLRSESCSWPPPIAGCDSFETASAPLDRVRNGIYAYLVFFNEHPQLVELLVRERAEFKDRTKPTYFAHRDANIGEWRKLFRQLIESGRVRNVSAAHITDVISDLVYGTMFTNFFAGARK